MDTETIDEMIPIETCYAAVDNALASITQNHYRAIAENNHCESQQYRVCCHLLVVIREFLPKHACRTSDSIHICFLANNALAAQMDPNTCETAVRELYEYIRTHFGGGWDVIA